MSNHKDTTVGAIYDRAVIDRVYSRLLHCNISFRFLGFIAQ